MLVFLKAVLVLIEVRESVFCSSSSFTQIFWGYAFFRSSSASVHRRLCQKRWSPVFIVESANLFFANGIPFPELEAEKLVQILGRLPPLKSYSCLAPDRSKWPSFTSRSFFLISRFLSQSLAQTPSSFRILLPSARFLRPRKSFH